MWLQDKGRNVIMREDALGDLLNTVAAYRDPNNLPVLMIVKDFSGNVSIKDKLSSLTPAMFPIPCPLARLVGIPLTVYAYPEARPGDPPSKGDPNMIAMLLTRRIEDGKSRMIKGKALVCLEDPRAPPGANLDLPIDLLVKILFFTGPCVCART